MFVEEKVNFVFFNLENGIIKWKLLFSGKVGLIKFVSDVDGDGEKDIVFVSDFFMGNSKGYINLVFGKLGKFFGNFVLLFGGYNISNIFVVYIFSSK